MITLGLFWGARGAWRPSRKIKDYEDSMESFMKIGKLELTHSNPWRMKNEYVEEWMCCHRKNGRLLVLSIDDETYWRHLQVDSRKDKDSMFEDFKIDLSLEYQSVDW